MNKKTVKRVKANSFKNRTLTRRITDLEKRLEKIEFPDGRPEEEPNVYATRGVRRV